jgi:putative phosphoribosyl transferase
MNNQPQSSTDFLPEAIYKRFRIESTEGIELKGQIVLPQSATALVVLATQRRDDLPENSIIAQFRRRGLAIVSFDLLTEFELQTDEQVRLDISKMAHRLQAVDDYLRSDPQTNYLPLGYFGHGFAAAAVIVVSTYATSRSQTLVLSNGRPDLACEALKNVSCPTLLTVAENEPVLLMLNQESFADLRCQKSLTVLDRIDSESSLKAVEDFFLENLVTQPLWQG